MRSFKNCSLHQIFLEWSNPEVWWAGYVESIGAMRNVYKVAVGKTEGKKQFGRQAQMEQY
jgi:hypothetical protein